MSAPKTDEAAAAEQYPVGGNTFRFPSRAFDATGKHIGPGKWLALIHATNGITPDAFGNPDSTGPWWAGGYVEEYPEYRVIHHTDDTTTVAAKTSTAAATLRAAATEIGE